MNPKAKKDSIARQVGDYLASNPDEELTRSDIAKKFGVAPTAVEAELRSAIATGRIRQARDEDEAVVYRFGGANTTAPGPFAAGERASKTARMAKLRETRAVDLSKVMIEKGVPYVPPLKRGDQWNSLFEQMVDLEDSFEIPLAAKHALLHAANTYRKTRSSTFRYIVRNVSETHCRIWRTA